ncbi:putative ankyrin repeat domain-containing protein 20A2, partial [Marmota marmota marmota]|uniref:putative ankyrin repeat domain-containing protein 20A2 n=1 Tax=Marmota marmota marmota TaxID=9994 RepID=UPI002091F709
PPNKSYFCRTPLHYACAYGQAEVVAFLVKNKCDINLCDSDNNTPLIKAIQQQEEECATILLENGADVNVQDPNGGTPLHHAICTNNTSVAAKLLLHNANIEAQNKDGCTPLLLALKENKHHVAEFLIKAKANIHAVDMRGRTALMLAVSYESPDIIKLLIEGGIDVFAEDVDGGTALRYSVASGCNMKIMFDCTEAKRKMRKNTKEGSESSTEDSLTGYSDKPGPSDSMLDEGSNQSDAKNIAREKELCEDFQQSSKDGAISDTGTQENKTLFDNSCTECQKEDEDENNLVQFFSIKTPFFSATDSKSENTGVFTVKYPPVCLPGCVTGPFSEAEAFKIINIPPNQSVPMKEAKTLKSAKPYLHVTPEDGRKIFDGTQIQQPKERIITSKSNKLEGK